MKTTILSQQLVHFRNTGHIQFENYPFELKIVRTIAKSSTCPRDLWRKVEKLKKLIVSQFGPMALELVKKPLLRLACDHYFFEKPEGKTFKDLFCFQGLACIFVLAEDESGITTLSVYEPSSLLDKLPQECYIVAFGLDTALIIDNPKDPFTTTTRNLGYVYGDRLTNPHHPLIVKK